VLARYEVHLDRKLERMLTMLLRLKELRSTLPATSPFGISAAWLRVLSRRDCLARFCALPLREYYRLALNSAKWSDASFAHSGQNDGTWSAA
jgi:hypothetical protein